MPTAEAHVQTERPSRYLVQLCQHFNHKGSFLGSHRPEFLRPELMNVEWSADHGTVSFGWGQCTMQAGQGVLILRAEADSEENLRRVQDVVTRNLSRFGRRDRLTVTWQQLEPVSKPDDHPDGPGDCADLALDD
jgi:hypothetical protein